MTTIIAFLLYIGVITSPEQATQQLQDAHRMQYETHCNIIGSGDIAGW